MEIITAEHQGFCYGVKRAVAMAEGCIGQGNTCTLGPIIHNPQVVQRLETKGIGVINDLSQISNGTVIIRSHGVGPEIYKQAEAKNLQIIDATCPHVKKAQMAAKAFMDEGYQVIVIGEKHHPEVKSIVEWTDDKAIVIESIAEAGELAFTSKLGVVSQTTFAAEIFQNIVNVITTKCAEIKVDRTICTATDLRQSAAIALAAKVDVMVVVGGKNSGNTTRLAELCRSTGCSVYHIETANELKVNDFTAVKKAGITAGASTPDWLIEEVYLKMTEINEMLSQEIKKIETGSIIKGQVISVQKDEVFVDIGYKAEGIITKAELAKPTPENAADIVSAGDLIDVYVLDADSTDGAILLSKVKADQVVIWDKIEDALKSKQPVEGKVVEAVKGGLKVVVFGVNAFVPASHIELHFVEDLSVYANQTLTLVPIEVDKSKNRIVLSRKVLLAEERNKRQAELFDQLAVGQALTGTIHRIINAGVFVDIGGVDGFVHISDLAWHKVKNPTEIVQIGEQVKVIVLKIDKNTKKISLGLKQVEADPWLDLVNIFTIGMIVTGKVSKLTNFGAFVELEKGVEGLVHLSELAEGRTNKPEEVVSVVQAVKVKILDIDKQNKRIALSIIKAQQEAERQEYQGFLDNQNTPMATIGDKLGYLFKKDN